MPVVICVSANPSLDQVLVTRGFKMGGKVEPVRWTVIPGGSGVRIGNVVREMGAPVTVTGFRGGGSGAWHAQLMDEAGLPHDFVPIREETRGTVLILDESRGFMVELPGPGPSVTEADAEHLVERVASLSNAGDWVIVSGRLPTGAPVDLYARLTRAARARGARVAVDARGAVLLAALDEVPDLWKPNAQEMQDAMAEGLDPVALCERGATILLSEGRNGALLLRPGDRPLRFAPPPRRPWNPAGSGNALLAATVATLCLGGEWVDAVRHGLAAGVANMQYDVAGHATREEVDRLAPLVIVTEQ
ncbi:MAG TPA: PfkB family carbohydrate kinase [Armatimonadota bacterium]|jgi:1-phosphofructokinase family hexose kinase